MIRVTVERKLKNGEDIGRLLMDLHMIAVLQKGHISNETWIDASDNHNITILSTWQCIEDWKAWESSEERASIVSRIDPLLIEEARIKIYEMLSPLDYEYYVNPESWVQAYEHPHFEG